MGGLRASPFSFERLDDVTAMVSNPAEADQMRETFFRHLFGQIQGYICIAFLDRTTRKLYEHFFWYPNELSDLLGETDCNYTSYDAYFCPHLLKEEKRVKENASYAPTAWADLDTCKPSQLSVAPTVTVESSPQRYQAYWVFQEVQDPGDIEDLNRRIAYAHQSEGADITGWDLTQLLRIPMTYNLKRPTAHIVRTLNVNRNKYRLEDFNVYPQTADGVNQIADPMPEIPEETGKEVLERHSTSTALWGRFEDHPTEDWSKALWVLELNCFEAGLTKEETFIVARDSNTNKYARDNRPDRLLWKEVCRAEEQNRQGHDISTTVRPSEEKGLLTEEEKEQELEPCFVEHYIEWATSLGDAAPQFHEAGAFIVLSSLLSSYIRLPTNFGTFSPNLWFLITADSTLSRKTTSMDLAIGLVEEVDEDVILATDGSIEGLMTSLSWRPGRASVFLRDEFTGLLDMMSKKDYYAGMAETFTKLYDGKVQKRVLRRETVTVKNPVLIFYAGGIRRRLVEQLHAGHITSGLLPRFVIVSAETRIDRLQPLGPPTGKVTDKRGELKQELNQMVNFYSEPQHVTIEATNSSFLHKRFWDIRMTPEAWDRYNKLEKDLLTNATRSLDPDIMTPTYDRLAKNLLKAAMLIAASRCKEEPVVEEHDIVHAARYGVGWKDYITETVNSVGQSGSERQIHRVYETIKRNPDVSRSSLMQRHKLDSRSAELIFNTLEQRGMISGERSGRGFRYRAR